jgi:hypothetical protein
MDMKMKIFFASFGRYKYQWIEILTRNFRTNPLYLFPGEPRGHFEVTV